MKDAVKDKLTKNHPQAHRRIPGQLIKLIKKNIKRHERDIEDYKKEIKRTQEYLREEQEGLATQKAELKQLQDMAEAYALQLPETSKAVQKAEADVAKEETARLEREAEELKRKELEDAAAKIVEETQSAA